MGPRFCPLRGLSDGGGSWGSAEGEALTAGIVPMINVVGFENSIKC